MHKSKKKTKFSEFTGQNFWVKMVYSNYDHRNLGVRLVAKWSWLVTSLSILFKTAEINPKNDNNNNNNNDKNNNNNNNNSQRPGNTGLMSSGG